MGREDRTIYEDLEAGHLTIVYENGFFVLNLLQELTAAIAGNISISMERKKLL